MKQYLSTLFLCLIATTAGAQRLTHNFQGTSLSEVLV